VAIYTRQYAYAGLGSRCHNRLEMMTVSYRLHFSEAHRFVGRAAVCNRGKAVSDMIIDGTCIAGLDACIRSASVSTNQSVTQHRRDLIGRR
jgi:hypothetical protein